MTLEKEEHAPEVTTGRTALRAVCQDCRSVQPVDNRFCSECGSDLHHDRPILKSRQPAEPAATAPTSKTSAAAGPAGGPSLTVAVAGLGFCGIVIGSFLPWATVGIITVNGTDRDGVATLIIGAVGLLFVLIGRSPTTMLLALVAAGGAGLIGVYAAANVDSLPDVPFVFDVRVGAGLYLIIVCSVVAGVAALWRSHELSPR